MSRLRTEGLASVVMGVPWQGKGQCAPNSEDAFGLSCYVDAIDRTGDTMAKPNYAFAKRQRELAKKEKKEAKMRERMAEKSQAEPPVTEDPAQPTPEKPE
jgi:hypothetical protein